jgi:hydroxylamine reductase (hybrid-cluster protein)
MDSLEHNKGGNKNEHVLLSCQETAKGTGCSIKGVCGKTEEVSKLQDLLIYTLKGIADIVVKER